jgi:hypothetical protein
MPPLVAVTLAIVAILALSSIGAHHKSFFLSSRFLLPVMISISLFVNFSIYLVQPNPFARPLFATVDAYRDFANAARIVKLSGFRPEDLVGAGSYVEFPVVSMLISILSLVGALSIQEGLIILAVTFEILGVVGVWLLSTAVVRKFDPAFASSAGVLTVILVWLQPYFIDPSSYLAPLRFSIPLLVLVVYLLYRTQPGTTRLATHSFFISILILVAVIVPMHAATALAFMGFCVLAGLLAPTQSQLARTVVLIALVSFSSYVLSGAALPYAVLLAFAARAYSVLAQIMSHGPTIISNAAIAGRIVQVSELDNYMNVLPDALVLSICTVCVAKSLGLLRGNLQARKLNLLHLAFGLFAFFGVAGGLISSTFGLDMRYFAFPITPLLVVACAVILSFALRNATTSRMRGLVLIGVVMVYAFSLAGSPNLLYETNPLRARMLPTESESAAGQFVSINMQINDKAEILSDWPFYQYVEGLTYSNNIGIEQKIHIIDLMEESFPSWKQESFVILRQYYLQNLFLEEVSPYTGVLKNVGMWNSPNYNKIYDSSTTWVYLSTFE